MAAALATPFLHEDVIARVVAMPDVVARNYAITRGYHALSDAMSALLGRDNANWLTFGQWASAEAGRAIRRESIPGFARRLVGAEVAAAVAAGNAAVFGDVAPPFARFVLAFRAGYPGDGAAAAALADLCDHPDVRGSDDLRRAFTAYVDALRVRTAGVPRQVARRMLLANVSIGAHEQIVADPHVRAAVPGTALIAMAATGQLRLHLPDATLALAEDVPAPAYLGGAQFPEDLVELGDADLLTIAARFHQDPDSAARSDAPNWEDYTERMGFIFTFLRAWQQDPDLFALPPDTLEVPLP